MVGRITRLRMVEGRVRIVCVLVVVAFSVLLERKILRLSQNRSRPIVNRWWGVIQTVLDGVKLLRKEKKEKMKKGSKS